MNGFIINQHYFHQITTIFKIRYEVKLFTIYEVFEQLGVFRIPSNIWDGVFLRNQLTTLSR